ncbi:MAG: 2-phospho-L-lactate guanylyltransferase [Gammaproteobacteria bacterium]
MPAAWALVPIKPFATAKSRLDGLLTRAECARLAEEMARDVLRALQAAPDISGIALLSTEPRLAALAETSGARIYAEQAGEDYRVALGRVAADLQTQGVRHLLVVPADLPTLSASDITRLLNGHRSGVTVCPAASDGGTNALLLSPPTVIPFLYGPDSAARHLAAATAAGVPARSVAVAGFARDVDSPEDLRWLLGQRLACATLAWLKASGVTARLKSA